MTIRILPDIAQPSLVCLKSFGDFVIARSALRNASPSAAIELVIGDHLVELHEALGITPATTVIAHREGSVPALFDMKKAGIAGALRSGLQLRRLLATAHADTPSGRSWLFDRLGLRERFIAGTASIHMLPAANNIYTAYSQRLGVSRRSSEPPVCAPGGTVGIFPGSRIAAKNLPIDVIEHISESAIRSGLRPTIFCLEGESDQLRYLGRSIAMVPRSFAAMAQAVRSVDRVISADSLPAHLAEFYERPVFVLSPRPNTYWLPLSCLSDGRWAVFDDLRRGRSELLRFAEPGGAQ